MAATAGVRIAQPGEEGSGGATENTYDQVPYRSYAFRQAHADRLSMIATLHGLEAPQVDHARILELGSASGGNIIPMAEQLPGATCLGIDGSARQIAVGKKLIERAGLRNVELRHEDILHFEAAPDSYDYIICHGVFSWVPDAVQRKILDLCGRCLSPRGVAYISYNTHPGWRMRGMIRDIMRYRAQFFSTPSQQLSQARGLLTFLSESVKAENNAYGILLKNELESMLSADDSYLFHEHLEENNAPLYFHQFHERAAQHGLEYLGEADFASMSVDNFPDRVKAMLQSVARDVIEMEQYMDFLRNRTFRQTLLCRRDAVFDRTARGKHLLKLHIASNSTPETEVDLAKPEKVTFRRGTSSMTTSDPVVKAAMLLLKKAWPAYVPLPELAAAARSHIGERMAAIQADSMSPATLGLAETFLRCHGTGQIDLHSLATPFTTQVADRPTASPLARIQAQDGSQVTDRTHGTVNLDDFHRQLLGLIDGQHDRARMLDAMTARVQSGALMIHRDGQRLTDPAAVREVLTGWIDRGLESFSRMALLVG